MGVPKFYRWLSERYPCLSEVVCDDQIPEFDNLYLDMNGIIHNCSHPDDNDVTFQISEDQIFHDIFHYVDVLFGIIKPKKVFFMAVDGVAPRAKMNQQRARRFMSAKKMLEALKKAKNAGVEIPIEKPFDSNCITPGTMFMDRLHQQLQYFIQLKIATDSCWQGLRVYLSGHDCPGEGEHKIMDFIRYERSRFDYNPDTRHCLYGLDADLIMLGMCTHEPHFALLREEVKFGRRKNRTEKYRCDVDGLRFQLLHLSLLREYVSLEFLSLKDILRFKYDLECVIDDWVLMAFLVGNDFIPHLPHIFIHDNALSLLYHAYSEVLPQLDGYINEAGILNLRRFEVFLKYLAINDKKNFIQHMDNVAYLSSKRRSYALRSSALVQICPDNPSPEDIEDLESCSDVDSEEEMPELVSRKTHKEAFDTDNDFSDSSFYAKFLNSNEALSRDSLSNSLLNDEDYENDCQAVWTPIVNREFKNYKRTYYCDKLKYKNISKEELREQAQGYIRAIQWNLHYYYHGCCSWSWFYPHHYAPYISDIVDFADMEMGFDFGKPFLPFEQLLAVLPASSSDCLPVPFQELMSDPSSPIIDFYPEEFNTDLNGKKNEWEAVVLIPFIEENRLLEAVATKLPFLNSEEQRRNRHGPHLLFTYDQVSSHYLKSSYPSVFPDIGECSVKVEAIGMDQFRIPRNVVVHGMLPGVKLGVVFPGFPVMTHMCHRAELLFADIRVFQQPSKNQSLIINIDSRPDFPEDTSKLALKLIGAEVHVNWPLLQKALVCELWTSGKNEYEKRGICVREPKGIVIVKIAFGSRKFFDGQNMVTEWFYPDVQDTVPVSLGLVVQNTLENWDMALSLKEAYSIGKIVFICTPASRYYGFPGVITRNCLNEKKMLLVSCSITSTSNVCFDYLIENYNKYSLKWYNVFEVSKFLRSSALGRITGFLFATLNKSDNESSKSRLYNQVNIGLQFKLSKRNMSMLDFMRRSPEGYWLYSSNAMQTIQKYKMKYCLFCLKKFLSETLSKDPLESTNTFFVDSRAIKEVEKQIRKLQDIPLKKTFRRLMVKPRVLFMEELSKGDIMPDRNVQFQLLDRVVCVRKLRTAPCGEFGTVIGVHEAEEKSRIEVLFDKPFFGGKAIRGSKNTGAKLPPCALINLTHGMRVRSGMKSNERAKKPGEINREFSSENMHKHFTGEQFGKAVIHGNKRLLHSNDKFASSMKNEKEALHSENNMLGAPISSYSWQSCRSNNQNLSSFPTTFERNTMIRRDTALWNGERRSQNSSSEASMRRNNKTSREKSRLSKDAPSKTSMPFRSYHSSRTEVTIHPGMSSRAAERRERLQNSVKGRWKKEKALAEQRDIAFDKLIRLFDNQRLSTRESDSSSSRSYSSRSYDANLNTDLCAFNSAPGSSHVELGFPVFNEVSTEGKRRNKKSSDSLQRDYRMTESNIASSNVPVWRGKMCW
ncbi:unnamed protein product [Thelazia callipaeda]|uniref:5'-3' exoribonuclease 1 n=1 Tax=Thelazia callipaeda TaxID=103827 RepID=A0A0N5D3U0_THECL|nr:unnamed protein product [Thelazia callipaeda]